MTDLEKRVENLALLYGDGADGACPTRAQWRTLIDKAPDGGVTLINFFKMRDNAIYPANGDAPANPGTGELGHEDMVLDLLRKIAADKLGEGPTSS